MARLLIDVLYHYREQKKYLLHEFVVMPDHLHLLISPLDHTTIERSIQLIKGGFSFRVKKELEFDREIWQGSFHDRRVRDLPEYETRRRYIHLNPVEARIVASPELFDYSSASRKFDLDPVPQRLKPEKMEGF